MTDNSGHFISESSVYRILKAVNLITSPNHILVKAANEFKDKTTRIHQMWQTDFTLENASQAFGGAKEPEKKEVDTEKLYAQIGQLKVENDFLKKSLKRTGL